MSLRRLKRNIWKEKQKKETEYVSARTSTVTKSIEGQLQLRLQLVRKRRILTPFHAMFRRGSGSVPIKAAVVAE